MYDVEYINPPSWYCRFSLHRVHDPVLYRSVGNSFLYEPLCKYSKNIELLLTLRVFTATGCFFPSASVMEPLYTSPNSPLRHDELVALKRQVLNIKLI